MKSKWSVLIGRFQPPHPGHIKLIRQGLKESDGLILVLGSQHSARTLRNPFTSEEREQMIRSCLTQDEQNRIRFVAVRDYFYQDDFWTTEVRARVRQVAGTDSVSLLGNARDFTSYYLKLFPEWEFSPAQEVTELNSTDIRNQLFCETHPRLSTDLPAPVIQWLQENFFKTQFHHDLCEELKQVNQYKKDWAGVPYPPVFVTVDAVVIHSGHILLIRRKDFPGKGLYALPGGFLEPNERIRNGAIRELKEETQIDVSESVLNEHLKLNSIFDHPLRSARGRTITHAYCFLFQSGLLPKIRGSDDASEAVWLPILDLSKFENQFFEDHFHIINYFTRSY